MSDTLRGSVEIVETTAAEPQQISQQLPVPRKDSVTPLSVVRKLPGRPFQPGNKFGKANRGRRPLTPVAWLHREIRLVHTKLKSGRLEAHVANALVNCLKFELELIDRFDTAERLAEYQVEITRLERRLSRLHEESRR